MSDNSKQEQYETKPSTLRFLPDLCTAASVLSLVLIGELLALALTIVKSDLIDFDWSEFGIVSFLIQWVMLSTAATLCASSRWLNALSAPYAFGVSYAVVLVYTVIFSLFGYVFFVGWESFSLIAVLSNAVIAAIFAGILLRYLYVQASLTQKEQSEADARLIALQSRIRPHFLFNSLNSIASLIHGQPDQAEKTVLDLSRLFRASLSLPRLIPIEQEIELCKSFADIEQLRLGERLTICWEISELPENAQVLSLLIQPLLENAIYHGIQPSAKGGTVTIAIKRVEKDIVIKITNPYLLGEAAVSQSKSEGAGIALSNIRSRLEASYGRRAYLRVVKGETDFNAIVRYPAES